VLSSSSPSQSPSQSPVVTTAVTGQITTTTITKKKIMIQNNESYQNFITTLQSKYTQRVYRRALCNFLEFLKIKDNDCSKLILEYDIKAIETFIRDYILHMRNRNLSPSTINCNCAAIKHFFDINDIDLRWSKKLVKFKGNKDDYYYYYSNNDNSTCSSSITINNNNNNREEIRRGGRRRRGEIRAYTREEIHKLLNSAQDQRAKVMILLMASSGIRIGSFLSLRIRNLIPIDKYGIYQVIVYENTRNQHYTFCSQECRKEIDNYLEYRKRNGETIKPESPLIREQFNTRNRGIGSAKPRFLGDRGLTKIIAQVLSVDTGIKEIKNEEDTNNNTTTTTTTETHSFRRFFETTAIKEGLSPLYVNILMNHDIGLEKSYFKPTVNDLLEGSDKMSGYIQIMNAITINDENRLSKQVQELKEQDDYQKYVIDKKIKEKDDEIAKMRQAMRTVLDTVNEMRNDFVTKQNEKVEKDKEIKDDLRKINDHFRKVESRLFETQIFTQKLEEVEQKRQEIFAKKGFVTKEDEEVIKNSILEDVKQNDPDLWQTLFHQQ
jgi:integrase